MSDEVEISGAVEATFPEMSVVFPDDTTLDSEQEDQEEKEEEDLFAGNDISLLPEPKSLEEMTYDERINLLKKTVTRHPLHRELHYKTLKFCTERHTLTEVEDFIASCPEFPHTRQSPYFLLRFLMKGGGIEMYEVDAEGNIVTEEQKEGLTEDEIDDLVVNFAYECNDIGRDFIELMSPQARILELLEITPEYYDTFIEVLDFLTEDRSIVEITNLLRGRDVLMVGRDPEDTPIQPTVFIDKLEKAGGVCWKDAWFITEEGKEVLDKLKERRA